MLLPGVHLERWILMLAAADHSFPSAAGKLAWPDSFLALPGRSCGVVVMPFLGPRIKSQTQLRD